MENPKRSRNAKAVAQEVIETVRKGKKVNFQEIQKKHGYSERSAKAMKATQTKSFKEEIDPVLDAMERERSAILKDLKNKRSKAKYRDLIDGLDKLTKNIQLLGGKETGNQKVTFGWEEEGDEYDS